MCEGVAFVVIGVGLTLLCKFVGVSIVVSSIVSTFVYFIDVITMPDLIIKCF